MHGVVIFRAAAVLHMNLPECSYRSTFSSCTKAGLQLSIHKFECVCVCLFLF